MGAKATCSCSFSIPWAPDFDNTKPRYESPSLDVAA